MTSQACPLKMHNATLVRYLNSRDLSVSLLCEPSPLAQCISHSVFCPNHLVEREKFLFPPSLKPVIIMFQQTTPPDGMNSLLKVSNYCQKIEVHLIIWEWTWPC